MKKVLVTGGSGFVGRRLALLKPDWTYVSSADYSLDSYKDTQLMYRDIRPDAVIHLASVVGGIRANKNNPTVFFEKNILINLNVVRGAFESNTKRVLASLSTCAFPDTVSHYPFNESNIFEGSPSDTNLSYAMSKRALYVHCNAYRKKFNLNYSTFSPSNIYGPGDHFLDPDSHFIAALVRKLSHAKLGDEIDMLGTGNPLRQQLYVDDLIHILPRLLISHNSDAPLIISPDENLSIKEMCEIGNKISQKDVRFKFNGELDGQFRKDGSNSLLKKMIGNFKFTTFEEGFRKTYRHYSNLG